MGKIDLEHLRKKWVHSKEEDTETQTVYRPATFKFPPTREGRYSLDIKPDGNLVITGKAGADDRQTQRKANWKMDGNALVLNDPGVDKNKLNILSLEKDKLVVEK